MEKMFILHWLTGKEETVKGISISDAFTKAGYGYGALKALDYYEEVKTIERNDESV